MNYRYATILAEVDLGAAGTKVIDLNIQDPISRLEISYRPKLADMAMLRALADNITKVELVDGSDVLHSLDGCENQAVLLYDRRVKTLNSAMLWNGAYSDALLGIDFGRYLYDPELAFDPTKFRNPQLKISHDRARIGATTTNHNLEIFARCFDEKAISPIGFLMAKEHYSCVIAADNAFEYVDLPTDHPIRQMLVRGWHTRIDPTDVVDHLRLSEDNDKRIPFDCNLEFYVNRMKGEWQILQEGLIEYIDPGESYNKFVTPTDEFTTYLANCQAGAQNLGYTDNIRGGYVRRINSGGGTVGSVGIVTGYLPHHCIQIPFGNQQDLNDWYDVTRLGSLRARLQAAANFGSGSEISIILQQLRRY